MERESNPYFRIFLSGAALALLLTAAPSRAGDEEIEKMVKDPKLEEALEAMLTEKVDPKLLDSWDTAIEEEESEEINDENDPVDMKESEEMFPKQD